MSVRFILGISFFLYIYEHILLYIVTLMKVLSVVDLSVVVTSVMSLALLPPIL